MRFQDHEPAQRVSGSRLSKGVRGIICEHHHRDSDPSSARLFDQQEFADLVGIKQSRVSAMEDENYSAWSTKTLKRIAAGKDVVFLGRFFSFGELLNWSRAMSEDALRVPSFSNDPAFLGASAINSMQATTSGLNALAIGSSQTTVTPLATAHVATNQFSQASLPLMGLVRSNTSNTLPRALVIDAVA